ncbi:MAG: ParB N-terminal domain-containing protein [Victivallaceae bacterium]
MFIEDIKTAPPFRELFPIQDAVLERIIWDMRKNGYDPTQPIVLWDCDRPVVIDGHSRLRAARKAGLFQIPVVRKKFPDEAAALRYAIGCQRNRRNLRDADILRCISELKTLSEPKCHDEIHVLGHTTQAAAALLGISEWKLKKSRAVLRRAPEELIAAVQTGEISINKAYERMRKPAASPPDKLADIFKAVTARLDKNEISELITRFQEYLAAS